MKLIENIKDVLENNICVGCGICGINNKNVEFRENKYGEIIRKYNKRGYKDFVLKHMFIVWNKTSY